MNSLKVATIDLLNGILGRKLGNLQPIQIEVTGMFVSATDDFTSKSEITSHLNLKKLTSHDHVHDCAVFTENSQGYVWTD